MYFRPALYPNTKQWWFCPGSCSLFLHWHPLTTPARSVLPKLSQGIGVVSPVQIQQLPLTVITVEVVHSSLKMVNQFLVAKILSFFALFRCFGLIESSTLEQTREETETEKMTHLESLVELGLSSTFSTILTQCSKEIFMVRMHSYRKLNCLVILSKVIKISYFKCIYQSVYPFFSY